jgi:hypothetical protein
MEDLTLIQDEQGRIIKAVRGDKQCTVDWAGNDLDIEYCNTVLFIVFAKRELGGDLVE